MADKKTDTEVRQTNKKNTAAAYTQADTEYKAATQKTDTQKNTAQKKSE